MLTPPLLPSLTDLCRQLPSKLLNPKHFFLAVAFANKGFHLFSDESKLVPLLISERNSPGLHTHTLPPHPTHPFPLLRVEYSQTLQHSSAAHTTRSLFTAEQPVTLPGPHSIETLASDPVAAVTPPDVSLLCVAAAVAGCIRDSGKGSQHRV